MKKKLRILNLERELAESRHFERIFRGALTECSHILAMPGCPDLADVPAALRKRLAAQGAACCEDLAEDLECAREVIMREAEERQELARKNIHLAADVHELQHRIRDLERRVEGIAPEAIATC